LLYTPGMSRAFINEDAGAGEAPRFALPSRDDPAFDGAAARALLRGADLGDTASAEAATGYYWGEPKLRSLVERIRDEALEDGDERLEQLAERFLRASARNTRREGTATMERDEALNPHRGEELARAREHTIDLLAHRGVKLTGTENDEDLADLWSAVERFEAAVEARGGDTFVNSPASSEPENPDFVLPERKPREPAADYTRRILDAVERLSSPGR
jgi:hypothetical protein